MRPAALICVSGWITGPEDYDAQWEGARCGSLVPGWFACWVQAVAAQQSPWQRLASRALPPLPGLGQLDPSCRLPAACCVRSAPEWSDVDQFCLVWESRELLALNSALGSLVAKQAGSQAAQVRTPGTVWPPGCAPAPPAARPLCRRCPSLTARSPLLADPTVCSQPFLLRCRRCGCRGWGLCTWPFCASPAHAYRRPPCFLHALHEHLCHCIAWRASPLPFVPPLAVACTAGTQNRRSSAPPPAQAWCQPWPPRCCWTLPLACSSGTPGPFAWRGVSRCVVRWRGVGRVGAVCQGEEGQSRHARERRGQAGVPREEDILLRVRGGDRQPSVPWPISAPAAESARACARSVHPAGGRLPSTLPPCPSARPAQPGATPSPPNPHTRLQAGKLLAHVLMSGGHGGRPVTLVGHSLGARVIFHCLLELCRHNCRGAWLGGGGRRCGRRPSVCGLGWGWGVCWWEGRGWAGG